MHAPFFLPFFFFFSILFITYSLAQCLLYFYLLANSTKRLTCWQWIVLKWRSTANDDEWVEMVMVRRQEAKCAKAGGMCVIEMESSNCQAFLRGGHGHALVPRNAWRLELSVSITHVPPAFARFASYLRTITISTHSSSLAVPHHFNTIHCQQVSLFVLLASK